ncbi:MAG: ATP phosphoribosyltransferase regulatory subunit [Pseudomonadota bacterium]
MLNDARSGPAQSALNDALALLAGLFSGAGYTPLAAPYLFPGNVLLDVYGEDLRARAFLFPDQGRGNELCLRPDFTVPVALAHGESGWDRQAAYAYQGPVFRNQPQGQDRPVEYLQAGIERFGDVDAVTADAQIFALLHRGLAALGIGRPQATIGDLAIPFALLDALDMPDHRRTALRRHFWRPNRFQDLLRRACAPHNPSKSRMALLTDPAWEDQISKAGEAIGLRKTSDVVQRLGDLAREAKAPPMRRADADLIGAVLGWHGPAMEGPAALRALTSDTTIGAAVGRMEARLDALADQGIDLSRLIFDASFGRNLEYYDGFVFEMRAPGQGEHPPLAGGGRYDSMTTRLGAPEAVPAIGGIIRPEAVLESRS